MKKLVLIFLSVLAFTGLSVAQDVYYSGYYTPSSGRKMAAVYKNNTRLYQAGYDGYDAESSAVECNSSNVFWTVNFTNPSNGYYWYAMIKKNNTNWLNFNINTDTYRKINGLYCDGLSVYGVGCSIISSVQRAVVWKGSCSATTCDDNPFYVLGNTGYDSEAFSCVGYNGHLYTVGIQYTSEGNDSYRGVLWKDGAELYDLGTNYKPVGISLCKNYNNSVLYISGTIYDGSPNHMEVTYYDPDAVWSPLQSWYNTDESYGYGISADEDIQYVAGQLGSSQVIWRDNNPLYTLSNASNVKAVIGNTDGVFYGATVNGVGKIYKDGNVLYQAQNCQAITDIYMEKPQCGLSGAQPLPFTESFDNGETNWPCWRKDDNNPYHSGWLRSHHVGDYIAMCRPYMDNNEGWLISPKLAIPSGQSTTTLSFSSVAWIQSYETYPTDGCSVWVSTTNYNTSSFTKVWSETMPASTWDWKTVNIDLSAYNGQNIYIAFKYYHINSNNHDWYIDDVSVTQTITQYTITANANNSSWGTVTGGGQYNAGATCTLTATPASGYEFLYWKKGNTQVSTNPNYSFTVTEHATYTAYYQQSAPTQYTITVNANNNAWGTVSGGGQYNAGATCTLHATPASGYQFDSWKKNGNVVSTNPNYSFTVTENATYTAYFSQTPVTYYTITTNVTPSGSGTVTGGGTYPAGSSITLEAIPNNGYAFSQWQDGSTSNPRTLTVNGDATYTATFTQLQYTITTSISPAGAGTVTGGGAYHYGDNCTLTATANSGYEFQGWNDGNTQNPRTFTVTGNAAYTAIFSEVGATYYTVTATVSPSGAGTVTGTGTYEAGSVITLHAVANPGYTFDRWSDNSTQNPRTVTVNGDMDFTAYFNQNQYVITVVASPSNGGSVTGGGAYYYGEYATLTATPYGGYEFVGWSDGSSEPVHQVLVTGNATYTATFTQAGTTYYTLTTYVSPAGAGTVTGAGTYPAGATATLAATANSGYTFNRWNDGSTSNPRTVTVNNNMSFTAYFTTNQYTITVLANPSNGGTVTGGGTYDYGATATLTATPAGGFEFLQWSDGNTNSTRYVTVTQNATYTALFLSSGGTVYTLTVTGNALLGQTYGSGTYPAGSSVEIAAYPAPYARFVRWSDNNTDNPRTVTVNGNATYNAEFVALQRYTIDVVSANTNQGQAYGGGTYFEGDQVEISAIPSQGYVFTNWNDGNTENPRTVTVTGNATYTANFGENAVVTHTLTVVCNTEQGTVSGGGVYLHGATAVVQAFPNQGFTFTKWSDENTQNPRTVTVNGDMTLVAFFAMGVGENAQPNLMLYPNPAKSSIRIAGLEADSEVRIYNSTGELVMVTTVGADEEISVRDLATGLYLVRCGSATLRFVKEQ